MPARLSDILISTRKCVLSTRTGMCLEHSYCICPQRAIFGCTIDLFQLGIGLSDFIIERSIGVSLKLGIHVLMAKLLQLNHRSKQRSNFLKSLIHVYVRSDARINHVLHNDWRNTSSVRYRMVVCVFPSIFFVPYPSSHDGSASSFSFGFSVSSKPHSRNPAICWQRCSQAS